jgi:hypothetical protein
VYWAITEYEGFGATDWGPGVEILQDPMMLQVGP